MLVIHHLLCVIFILPFGSTKPCCVKPSKRHRQKRYSEDDICFGTNGTIVNVDTCPKNLCDFRRRSQRKNCDSLQSCRNESLVYHCVRFEDSIIEVCAPEGTIRGQCCPKYEVGLGRVIEDFSKPCPGCPFEYKSDNLAEYVECLATYRKNISDQGMADGRNNFRSSNITCNIHSSTNFSRENHNSTAGKEIGNYPDDIKIVLYTTGAVVIVTIILMLFFVSKRTPTGKELSMQCFEIVCFVFFLLRLKNRQHSTQLTG